MTGMGLHNVLIVRCITNLFMNILVSLVVLFIAMQTTVYSLNINLISLIIIVFLGIFSMVGIGLMFGGLALIFKQVKSMLHIIQYFLIGLLIINSSKPIIMLFLPFRHAVDMIFDIVRDGKSFLQLPLLDYGIIVGNSIIYFVVGVVIFKLCEKAAKKKGLLGQY